RNALEKFGEKQALEKYDPKWYCQAQVYMGYFDYKRHYLTVCSAGLRGYLSCRTEFDAPFFAAQRIRAKRILDYAEPPARIHADPSFYLCKMCEFREVCHG